MQRRWAFLRTLSFGLCSAALVGAQGDAQVLTLPQGAQALAVREMPFARYEVPIGGWSDGAVPKIQSEGRILRRTWRVNTAQTTLQLFDPLRQDMLDQGYDILFECHDTQCGGFDFRFAIDVVPAPDMAVDFGDFLFLSAKGAGGDYLTLLVSRFGRANFVQMVEIGSRGTGVFDTTKSENAAPAVVNSQDELSPAAEENHGLSEKLLRDGHAVLAGLEFQSGSTTLAQERYDSLQNLADFMSEYPDDRVLLVGHTDTVGSLNSNVSISLARANAVRDQLTTQYGIDPAKVDAAGAGYMSPLVSNENAAGREINRRVEVVLLPSG